MRMIGKTNQPWCGSKCCGYRYTAFNRMTKRRERQSFRRDLRNLNY